MKLFKKLIIIFLILIMCFSVEVFAGGSSIVDQIIFDMDPTNSSTDPTDNSRLLGIVTQIFTVIQFVGTGISIIMVMWLGITYMMTSIEQKAEIKKRAVPILIGSVLIVATVNILKLIQEIVLNSIK